MPLKPIPVLNNLLKVFNLKLVPIVPDEIKPAQGTVPERPRVNKARAAENPQAGDRVFSPAYRTYATVTKVNPSGVVLVKEDGGTIRRVHLLNFPTRYERA